MVVDWSMGARLFISDTRSGGFSQTSDFESDLRSCIAMARDWPPEVVFRLETDQSIFGKKTFGRDDLALFAE